MSMRRALAAAAGIGCAGYAFFALANIPRTADEFRYTVADGGNAFWPLPFAPLNGFTPEQLSSHVTRLLFLLPACVLAGVALRNRRLALPAPPIAITIVTGCALALGIHAFVTRGVPLQDDEATYVMQADVLGQGRLADGVTPIEAAFAEPFTVFTPGGMTGMYPFGTAAVLAAGGLSGVPWAGQFAMVALTLWCAQRAAQR